MSTKKIVIAVFGLIAVLVGIFLIWQLVFNDGGIIKTGYNALADGINSQYEKVAGKGETLLPRWGEDGNKAQDNGQGFDIETG